MQKFGALGRITKAGGRLERILAETSEERALALASLRYLRRTIRNRDAYSYTQNVRAFRFYVVEWVVLPGLTPETGRAGYSTEAHLVNLTLRAADVAAPHANVGGFSGKDHAPQRPVGRRRR